LKSRIQDVKKKIINWFKTMTWKKALILTLAAVLIALLIIIALFIYRTVINPKAAFDTRPTTHSYTSAQPDATPVPTTAPDVREQFNTERVNILVLGMDSSEQRVELGDRVDFRTDTMLLVSIDFDNKKVDMITVPRDSYVNVTKATGKLYKVNSAAYFGGGMCDSGFLNACDTISGVFGGLPVNYYVAADMDGLKALVDAIGGVDFNVDVDTSLDGITLTPGVQHLNGEQALIYCRVRKEIGNDLDRQGRQQRMIVSVLENLKKNGKISNVGDIYQSLQNMVYTNLSFEQICALGAFFSSFDDLNNISRHVLKGEFRWAYNVYFYLLDQRAKADLVKEIFGEEIEIDKKHDLYYVMQHTSEKDKEAGKSDKEGGDSGEGKQEPAAPTDNAQPTDAPAPSAESSPAVAPEEPIPAVTESSNSSSPPTESAAPAAQQKL
jgi:LCP family protein required for cell wall assembly